MTFARTVQPKPVRERSRAHLDWIKQLPCVACARDRKVTHGCDPAHVSYLQPRGLGQKTSDANVAPLCRAHHDDQHGVNEVVWWAQLGINPKRLCADLWEASGDLIEGESIIGAFAAGARRLPRLQVASGLTEPVDAAPRRVTISAHLADGRDEFGNQAVLLPKLGPRGETTTLAHVAPDHVQEVGQ